MTFRDIRTNGTLHLLHKDTITYEETAAEAVGVPRYDSPKVGQPSLSTGQVVDITIHRQPYVVQCDNSVAYSDKLVIATDKAQLLPEVKRLKTEAEAVLAGVDKAKDTVAKCDTLLCELDTAFKERQEADRRMSDMEGKISKLSDMIAGFISEFKK